MMKKLLMAALFWIVASPLSAAPVVNLADWAFNINGTVSEAFMGDSMPVNGTLDPNGFGTLTYEITTAGMHSFISFFDFEIDEITNTFFNEYGRTGGTLASGQSWEIDEPGYLFGDIYDNMYVGSLDNSNALLSFADDVSFALGWDFTLDIGETAIISITLSDLLATTGFYLEQYDTETGTNFDEIASIYAWSNLEVFSSPGASVPVPPPIFLLALGLVSMLIARQRNTV